MANALFLNTLCRGLVGYVSYLASCGMSTVYSEYLLYEPIARIGRSQGFHVICEVKADVQTGGSGDKKRIDFKFKKNEVEYLVEVKWVKNKSASVDNDLEKLRTSDASDKFLLIFGRHEIVSKFTGGRHNPIENLNRGTLVGWKSGKTHYAARWFRVD